MATVATIGNRALRLLGVIASGDTPSTSEQSDYLTALNALLSSWTNEKLMCYAIQDESFNLVANTSSYTIGSGGTFSTTRPVRIEGAYIVVNGVSYDVDVIDELEYAAIPAKTTTASWPDRLYYQPAMTSSRGTIYVYPVPSQVSALHLLTRTQVTAFSATTDTVTLPPGWEDALAYNLAVTIAPEFEREASSTVIGKARETKAAIKVVNSRPIRANNELSQMFPAAPINILTNQ